MYRIIEIIEEWIYTILSILFAGTGTAVTGIRNAMDAQATQPDWFTHCAPYFQIFAWTSAGVLAVFGIINYYNNLKDRRDEKRNKSK